MAKTKKKAKKNRALIATADGEGERGASPWPALKKSDDAPPLKAKRKKKPKAPAKKTPGASPAKSAGRKAQPKPTTKSKLKPKAPMKKKKKSASAAAAPAADDASGCDESPFGKKTRLKKKKKKKAPPPTSDTGSNSADAAAAASSFGKVAKMKRKKSVVAAVRVEEEAVEVAEVEEVAEEVEEEGEEVAEEVAADGNVAEEEVAAEEVVQEDAVTEIVAENGSVAEEKVAAEGGGSAGADGNNTGADAPPSFDKKMKRRKSVAAAPSADRGNTAADASEATPSPFGKKVKRRRSIAASAPVNTGRATKRPSAPSPADSNEAPPSPFGKKLNRRKSIATSASVDTGAAPELSGDAPPPPVKRKKKKGKPPPPAAPTTSATEVVSVGEGASPPPPVKRKKKKKSRAAPPPALTADAVVSSEGVGSPLSDAATASVASRASVSSATEPSASAAEVPNAPPGLAAQFGDVEIAPALLAALDVPRVAESKELVVGEREDADAEIDNTAVVAETKAAPEPDEPLAPVVPKQRKSRRRSTARARAPPASSPDSQLAEEPTVAAEAPPLLVRKKKKKKSPPPPPGPRATPAATEVVTSESDVGEIIVVGEPGTVGAATAGSYCFDVELLGRKLGLSVKYERAGGSKRIVVCGCAPGSEAATQGVLEGDIVEFVNGIVDGAAIVSALKSASRPLRMTLTRIGGRAAARGAALASAPATPRGRASSPVSAQSAAEIRLLLWLQSQGVQDVRSMEKLLAAQSGAGPDPNLSVAAAVAELQREMDASKNQARLAVARAKRVEAKLSSLKLVATQSRKRVSDTDGFSSSPTAFEARVALAYERSQRGVPAPVSPTLASGITRKVDAPMPGSFAATLRDTMSDMDRAVDAVLTATQENIMHKPEEAGPLFANVDAGRYRRSRQREAGSSAITAVPRYRASPLSAPHSPSYLAKARALNASTPELLPSEIDFALQLHDGHFGRASVQLALDRDFTVAALADDKPMRREMAIKLVEMHHDLGLTFHAAVDALRDEEDSIEWAQLRLGILRGHPELNAPDSRARALRLRRATGDAERHLSVEDVARALSKANNHFGRARLLLQLDRQEAPLRGAI